MKKILLCCLFFYYLNFSYAQPGALDQSFGNKGIVITDLDSSFNYPNMGKQVLLQTDGSMFLVLEINGLTLVTKRNSDGSTDITFGNKGFSSPVSIYSAHAALQTDGKIIIAGTTLNSYGYYNPTDFAVARFNTNGTLDNTFGLSGIQITDFGYRDILTSMVIQNDGKIIVAGTDAWEGGSFVQVARYNMDGSFDNTFDEDGKLSFDFWYATSIALQSDGKIILAGYKWDDINFAIARLKQDGSIDSSFHGGGNVATYSISPNGTALVAVQSNGKILLAGSNGDFTNNKIAIERFNTDGSADNTFDSDGRQTTDFSKGNETLNSIAVQSNGKIIIAGYTENGSTINFAIARYNTNGSPDISFSDDGIQITDFGLSKDYLNSLVIQGDGKLLALGYTLTGTTTSIVAARYNSDGSFDNSFDGNGTLIYRVSQRSTFYTCTAVQNDGKILAAGYTWNGSNYDFTLARYNINGTPDNTFSGDGKQSTDFDSSDDKAMAIAIQSDGKILLVGAAGSNFGVARYNTDGSPDTAFDKDGKQTTDFGAPAFAASVAIQTNGKIIAGGSALARYNSNGSLDITFDGDGKLTTPFDSEHPFNCNDVAIQNDGKIVVTGLDYYTPLIVVRYKPDGSKDNAFGYNGEQHFDGFPDNYMTGNLIIQKDGKIIVGGYNEYSYRGTTSEFELMRMNTDGTPDENFNGGQILYTYFNYNSYATSMALQSDNKIVLAGYAYNGTSDDFALTRYNTDGSLDNTFGDAGKVVTTASSANDRIMGIAIAGNKLYATGYGEYPGNSGVVARYLLDAEGGPFITSANGNWNNPGTWAGNVVPDATSEVIVRNNVSVTTNTMCHSLKVEAPGGNLIIVTGAHLTITH